MSLRRLALAALAATLSLAAAAPPAFAFFGSTLTPSGNVVTESRDAKGFSGIGLSIPGSLVVRQGEPASVSVEADDNLLPEIETVVERGVLKVRFKRSLSISGRSTIRLLVVAPKVESLSVSGSGDVLSEAIRSEALDISVAGSGDVRIAKLEATTLKVSISGSGDVKAAGKAGSVSVEHRGQRRRRGRAPGGAAGEGVHRRLRRRLPVGERVARRLVSGQRRRALPRRPHREEERHRLGVGWQWNPAASVACVRAAGPGISRSVRPRASWATRAMAALRNTCASRTTRCSPCRQPWISNVAALAEPMAVAVHAVRVAQVASGDRVVVLGAGTIGLLAVVAARAAGAGEVWCTARHPHQRTAAESLGAARVFLGPEASRALQAVARTHVVDAVIETVGGIADTITEAVGSCGRAAPSPCWGCLP